MTSMIKNTFKASLLASAVLAPTNANAIVGGSETGQGYPWMAHIKAVLGCGATLITENWLMTAAHCVVDGGGTTIRPEAISVILGQYSNQRIPGQYEETPVDRVVVHPGYEVGRSILKNDIALLHLAVQQHGTQTIQLATKTESDILKREATRLSLGSTALTVLGWGLESEKDVFSGSIHLRSVDLYTQSACSPEKRDDFFCVNHPQVFPSFDNSVSIGFCKGDSGGPLVTTHSGPVQYGIVSGYGTGARPSNNFTPVFDCGQGPQQFVVDVANMRGFISQYVNLDDSASPNTNNPNVAPTVPNVTPTTPNVTPTTPNVTPNRPSVTPTTPNVTPTTPSVTPTTPSVTPTTPNTTPNNPSVQFPGTGPGNGNQPETNRPDKTPTPATGNNPTVPTTNAATGNSGNEATDEADSKEEPPAAGALSSLLLAFFLTALRRRRF